MATDAGQEDTEELATAIGMVVLGEWTLGQAAERAGVSRFRLRETMRDRGVDVPVGGPVDEADAMRSASTVRPDPRTGETE